MLMSWCLTLILTPGENVSSLQARTTSHYHFCTHSDLAVCAQHIKCVR